jgi:hypothetical protein
VKSELIIFPSDIFSYNNYLITGECSDLGNRHLQPINNENEFGFAIQSIKTNNIVIYIMIAIVENGEGDIIGWDYVPSLMSQFRVPECRNTRAFIFNC